MRVSIQFDTDNAAFEDDFTTEAINIGLHIASRIQTALEAKQDGKRVLRDRNGNLIGWIVMTEVE